LIYTVRIANAGPSPATSIRVVNTLPEGADFDNAGGVGWECGPPVGRVVTCTLPSLATGASAAPLGIAVVPAPQGGTLTDSAVVSAIEADPVPANNTAAEFVVVNPAPATSFHTMTPCRLVDTRDPPAPAGGPALSANSKREFAVAGVCGVPLDARAVAANVTVVGATDVGDLRLHPKGTAVPSASTINFIAGQVRANSVVFPIVYGWVSVQCDMPPGSSGTVHFILDVSGYFR
jgi:hypothetical protein